ncbi:MAG: hypothetical protein AAFU85_03285 [Planctomycetota bacterium]
MNGLFDLLKFLIKVGFVESGRAIWWIGVGELFAFGFGILLVLLAWRLTRRIFSESTWGLWCRRLLLATWVILLTPALASNGFFWGLNVAAEKTIVAQQLIEHASQESLTIPIDLGLRKLEEQGWNGEYTPDLAGGTGTNGDDLPDVGDADDESESSDEPKLYSADELLENLDALESGLLKAMVEQAAGELEFDSSVIPDWVLTWIMRRALGYVKGESGPSVADYLDASREIIRDAKENDEEQDDLITSRQLAWSAGATQGVPVLHAYMAETRKVMLIVAGLQVLLIVGGTTGVFWLAAHLLDKWRSDSNDMQTAPSPSDEE